MAGTHRREVHRTCPLCEAMCGLRIDVEGDRVTRIQGDPEDPFSRGYLCPKGAALAGLHEDPDRLRRPLRRVGSEWREIGWEEALDLAADRLYELQRDHGNDAVGAYVGNPSVHNLGTLLYGPFLLRTLASRNRYSATSVDQLPHMLAALLMFGHQLFIPIPDVDRTDLLLIFGGNPLVSNGSLMTAPDMGRRLDELEARGGRAVVFDPRRTETARRVGEHVFIRPGTDVLVLAAMAHVIFEEGLARLDRYQGWLRGADEARAALRVYTPERAEAHSGVSASLIRELARALATTPRAGVYGRLGVSTTEFGGLCHWLIGLLNTISGGLDAPGGVLFPRPAFDIVGGLPALGIGHGSFDRYRSRVRRLPEFGGEFPVATMAEEMLTPGPGRLRGLLVLGGNPVLSTPNGARLDEALAGLDFMVSVDIYLNETSRHADLILPPTGPLEHDNYELAFHHLQVRNTAKWSPAVFEKEAGQRHDWQIIAGLERRLLARRGAPLSRRAEAAAREAFGPERIVDMGLRLGHYGALPGGRPAGLSALRGGLSLRRLQRAPHGIDLGPLEPTLPGRLPRRRGGEPHVDLAPSPFIEDLDRLSARYPVARDGGGQALLMIGRRHLRSNNSWMHNLDKLVRGKPRCLLYLHPNDATRLGLSAGDRARVASRTGALEVDVALDEDLMPGVVCLPHGFGHGRGGTRLRVANAHAGVSANDLTDPQAIDLLCGTARLSGFPVQVTPA